MSERDRTKWDAIHGREGYLHDGRPSSFLVESRELLPDTGRALDIAAGEGRDAVYLAEQGLEVHAIDISAVGLRKARALAGERGVEITVRLWDVARSLLPDGPFDVVVCLHYKQPDLASRITDVLAPGGVLLMELATVDNLERHKHPSRRYCVENNELLGWFTQLSVVSYQEAVFDDRAVARLIARKPA